MSGYLTHVAARSLSGAETIRPRLATKFEPARRAVPEIEEPAVPWQREPSSADSISFGLFRDIAMERQGPGYPAEQAGQVPAEVRVPPGQSEQSGKSSPWGAAFNPVPAGADRESIIADRTPDARMPGKRPDLEPDMSHVRPRMTIDRKIKLAKPDGSQAAPAIESAPAWPADPGNPSGHHVPADVGRLEANGRRAPSQESLKAGAFQPRVVQTRRQAESASVGPRSWIVRSDGLPLSQPRTGSATAEPQRPVVRVSIGRIDVRAIMPPPVPKPKREPPRPSRSLQEYLAPRSGGPR